MKKEKHSGSFVLNDDMTDRMVAAALRDDADIPAVSAAFTHNCMSALSGRRGKSAGSRLFKVASSSAVLASLATWAVMTAFSPAIAPNGEASPMAVAAVAEDVSMVGVVGTDHRAARNGRRLVWGDEFHVYGFEWTPKEMSFFVDGEKYMTVPIDEENDYCSKASLGMAGHHDFHNIHINNEVFTPGHSWSPKEKRITADDKLPIDYWVDWIRLYQKDGEAIRLMEREEVEE